MNYLSAEGISKSYSDKWLFKDLSVGLSRGQKAALVGINGSGKSTLLQVLAGTVPPDSGLVSSRKGVRIAFLGQNPTFDEKASVQDTLFSMKTELMEAVREYEALLADPNADPNRLQRAMTRMDELHAWDYEAKVHQVLAKLGIVNFEQPIWQLSGGQRKRVAMARVLIEEPDLLILDEPTNHLDLDTIEWLENFLATSNQTILMVTHDRYFLDRVTNEIWELERGQLYQYKGNYSYFLEKKAERQHNAAAEKEKAQNLMRKELDWMRRQPQARGTKSRSRIDAFYELQDKANVNLSTQQLELNVKTSRQGGKILEVDNISKGFGDRELVRKFSYVFKKKDRIGIIGKNGTGKTTFLEMLTGQQLPDKGQVVPGETTVFGYYRQEELLFKPEQRVIDIVKDVAEVIETPKGESITAARLLEHFQFPPSMHYTLVGKLSGGEKRRLQLLRVLMKNPNFLILDEPTNDLDLITLSILEDFLDQFDGCLLIVSHDRYFMDRLVDHLFVFEGDGNISNFPGNYTDYRLAVEEKSRKPAVESAPKQSTKHALQPAEPAKPAAGKRKLTYAEKREYEQLEQDIEKLEQEKEALVQLMSGGSPDHNSIQAWAKQMEYVEKELEKKSDRWLELSEFAD